jgi:hypothetical protein
VAYGHCIPGSEIGWHSSASEPCASSGFSLCVAAKCRAKTEWLQRKLRDPLGRRYSLVLSDRSSQTLGPYQGCPGNDARELREISLGAVLIGRLKEAAGLVDAVGLWAFNRCESGSQPLGEGEVSGR